LSPDEIGKPGLGLPAGVSVNEVNHMVGRIDEHHRPRQYIPQAKLAEALRAAARLRGERFHPDFVPPKAIRPATPIKWRRLSDFAAQRLRKINPELSFRHLETRNG
jgi:hypothetical protein